MADEAKTQPAPTPPAARAITRNVEHWQREKKTDPHLFAMARAWNRWQIISDPEPTRITEAQYDAGLAAIGGITLG